MRNAIVIGVILLLSGWASCGGNGQSGNAGGQSGNAGGGDPPKGKQEQQQRGGQPQQAAKDAGAPAQTARPVKDGAATAPDARVTLTRAIDGDTIEISAAVDGINRVRLIGIDAPEAADQQCGAQPVADAATEQMALWEGEPALWRNVPSKPMLKETAGPKPEKPMRPPPKAPRRSI